MAKKSTTQKSISLFSGAGGMDAGFIAAGYETCVAVEQDPSCCETLKKNMPLVPVIQGDINKITSSEILKAAGLRTLEPDIVFGGPPCQSFSLAGKRKGLEDPRGKLVWEFIRVVRDTLPKTFLLENVKGLVNWSKGKALQKIIEEAGKPVTFKRRKYTYKISFKVLNAVDYGAPQFRERIIIVGNRLNKNFEFPEHTHRDPCCLNDDLFLPDNLPNWKTAGDAILNLPPAEEPSETALRVSKTIRDRIKNHGY